MDVRSQVDRLSKGAVMEDDAVFRLEFRVIAWEAFGGPGLSSRLEWEAWARNDSADWSPGATPVAPVQGMQPILRRRADAADRLGLEVAFRLAPAGGVATVFASRHGQVVRSASLLAAQVKGEPASPMDFSLSVHNATAGQYAIASGDRHAGTSLSSRWESFSSGLLEAAGLLAEGNDKALLVMSDPLLPAPYPDSDREEPAGYGLGLLLGKDGGEGFTLSLDLVTPAAPDRLPQGLAFLRAMAIGADSVAWQRDGRRWTWARRIKSGPA
jgi:hypothetical protein